MPRFPHSLVILLAASTVTGPPAAGAQSDPEGNGSQRTLQSRRVAEPPQLDGRVDEALWQPIEPATGFIQRNPDEGEPSTEKTEVRIAFDDENLYVGIICFDSRPEEIVVNQNRRDGLKNDSDYLIVMLDTFHDRQNAFVFGTSPTGIEHDAQVSKAGQTRGGGGGPSRAGGGGGAQRGGSSALSLNWDGVWEVRSQITARGWESEMAIPFRTLRYKPGRDQSWGLNIERNLRRRNELSHWAPVSRAFRFIHVDLAGTLNGLEIRNHRSLKLLPYVLGGYSENYTHPGDPSKFERNVGLDLKYSLTPSLTLDGTVNTDFAQVEVDEEQVNLTRFDLFFPEKRPFFLENSGFFEFGTPREVEIFFSRRIGIDQHQHLVPIDGGARLSGKAGPYQLGLLNMQTRRVDGVVPANNYSVARFSRELPNRSSIGVIGVNRSSTSAFDGDRPHNRTFGTDANLGLGRFANWYNYAAFTQTPGLEGGNHAYSSLVEYDDSIHEFRLGYLEVGDHFNPEVGFIPRAGYRKTNYFYRFHHYPNGGPIRSWEPHASRRAWYSLENSDLESDFQHYHMDSKWQNGARLGVSWNRNFERLDEPLEVVPGVIIPVGRYGFDEIIANYRTDPSTPLFLSGTAAAGGFYNGRIRSVNVNGGYRHSHRLSWTASYLRNMVRLPVGDFNVDLVGLRFNWSFTPKSFLQTFSQYNSVTQTLGHNIRLGLLSSASTGLFVVYNTSNSTTPLLDAHRLPRRTLTRALFVKFNYLFDY